MGEESTLSEHERLEREAVRDEREAARRLELAAAKRRHAAELARIEAEFGEPAATRRAQAPPPETPKPQTQDAEADGSDFITMDGLIRLYVADKLYAEKRFRTRKFYDRLIYRIERDLGVLTIAEIDEARVLRVYEGWSADGKLSISHALVTMLRIIVGFGAKQLHRKDCRDLRATLSDLKFPRSKSQPTRLTADHAIAIRAVAHQMGHPSIALAQAFQFDFMLPQRDVLGEWVPQGEPGVSEVIHNGKKWLRGLRWNEIDVGTMTLQHPSSFDGTILILDLAAAPMVKEELARIGKPPSTGPMIIREKNRRQKKEIPWLDDEFRRTWRQIADVAGVPKDVRSRDSRTPADDDRKRNRKEAGGI